MIIPLLIIFSKCRLMVLTYIDIIIIAIIPVKPVLISMTKKTFAFMQLQTQKYKVNDWTIRYTVCCNTFDIEKSTCCVYHSVFFSEAVTWNFLYFFSSSLCTVFRGPGHHQSTHTHTHTSMVLELASLNIEWWGCLDTWHNQENTTTALTISRKYESLTCPNAVCCAWMIIFYLRFSAHSVRGQATFSEYVFIGAKLVIYQIF